MRVKPQNNKEKFDKYVKEHHSNDYIPIDKCKPNYLYRIHARNSSFGIYREE